MTSRESGTSELQASELHRVKHRWGVFGIGGAVLMILGIIALGSVGIATLASVWVFGILLIVAGVASIISAFAGQGWRGFTLHALLGVLSVVVGFMVIASPLAAAVALTLFLAVYFIAGGLFRLVSSVTERFAGWGWAATGGVASVALGLILVSQWPEATLWFIGLLLGIELIFQGATWIALAIGGRSLERAAAEPRSPAPA